MSSAGPWFEATPRRKNWTVKTPCLKCGLIHEEPTAVCDGYVGIDPDETAGDSRKQAAARIRAILAAVPIESRRQGRARGAAASAGSKADESPALTQAVGSSSDAPAAEVPEWRREVSERLESYRNKRERQARQSGTNQSVLEFRVHSKSEALQSAPDLQSAASAVLDLPAPEPAADLEASMESDRLPATLQAAAADTTAPTVTKSGNGNGNGNHRSYQPIEETEATADLTEVIAAVTAEIPENGNGAHEADTEAAELPSAEPVESPAAIPVATEPAVVLADATTLEVHADPVELADVQTAAEPAPEPAIDSAPLASIPAIDTEYWRSVPGVEAEEAECGSLTSGFESRDIPAEAEQTAAEEEPEFEEELAREDEAAIALHEPEPVLETEPEEEPELAAVAEAYAVEAAAEQTASLPPDEEVAVELHSESTTETESLFPHALATEADTAMDERRSALRTAARPMAGPPPERIEIRVPQPVFDFAPAAMENAQPQDEALPVADLRERRCAAILDAAMLGFTVAGFFLAFHLAGGEFSFSRIGMAVAISATFLIYAQYVLLFTFVGGSTPGMALRGLRVVCFDGRRPETVELAWRSFGYLLSAAAGMLGFLWSAWDEHGLSWHDRISQTYITYQEPEAVPAAATTT